MVRGVRGEQGGSFPSVPEVLQMTRVVRSFSPFLAALSLLLLEGCASGPPLDLPLPKDARVVELLGDYVAFQRSPQNRYAVVLKGQEFSPPDHPFRIGTSDDVRREGVPIVDPYVTNDVDQVVRLLVSKGYDVYRADMGEVSPADVDALLERI